FDLADAIQHGILEAGLGFCIAEAIGVAPLVAELQRVDRNLRGIQQFVNAVIEEKPQAVLARNLHMSAGRWNYPLVLLEILVEDHLAGLRTFYPEVLRHIPAAKHGVDLWPYIAGDPVHRKTFTVTVAGNYPAKLSRLFGWSEPCFAHTLGEAPDQRCNSIGRIGGHLPISPDNVGDRVDDGGTHDHAIGRSAYCLRLSRRLHTEADANGKVGMRLDSAYRLADLGGVCQGRTRDPCHRNVVDEA